MVKSKWQRAREEHFASCCAFYFWTDDLDWKNYDTPLLAVYIVQRRV